MAKKEKKAHKKQRQNAEREVKDNTDVVIVENKKSEVKDVNENFVKMPCPTFLSPPNLFTGRNPPCSPASPHTPPGLPPAYQCNSGTGTLSGYFTDPSDTTGNSRTFLTEEYIKNLSKINLAPRRPQSDLEP